MSKMTSLEGVSWATAYHDYFKGDPVDNRQKGETSYAEMDAISSGRVPLPSGCRLIFDVDNMPHGSDVLYWPTWYLDIYDKDTLVTTVTLNNETPENDIARIQGKDTPSSVWTRSSGYRLICVYEGVDYISTLRVRAEVGGIKSDNEFIFPKVSKK